MNELLKILYLTYKQIRQKTIKNRATTFVYAALSPRFFFFSFLETSIVNILFLIFIARFKPVLNVPEIKINFSNLFITLQI